MESATGNGYEVANSVVSSQVSAEDHDTFVTRSTRLPPAGNDAAYPQSNTPSSPPTSPRPRNVFGGRRGNASLANTSRPHSAISRRSMPQAYSMTSQAFFRPMSSQRLQAQRGARLPMGTNEDSADVSRLSTSTVNRPSLESSGAVPPIQNHINPPFRGTDVVDQDRVYYNSSPTGENTIRTGDSSQPLNTGAHNPQDHPATSSRSLKTPKTPQSFTSDIARFSSAPRGTHVKQHARRFPDSKPPPIQEKTQQSRRLGTGKNYEYFSGNTVFCWGGRLQNTRHRPINILTCLLIVLPAVLFFIFS
jgi:palmitoyltransferase ZDHHC9/14/18